MNGAGMLTILGNQGPFAGPRGACSGYLLQACNVHVLMDIGPGVLAQYQVHADLGGLDALLVSHYHPDHFSDLMTLRYALRSAAGEGLRARPLRLILPEQGAEAFRETYITPAYEDLFEFAPVGHGSVVIVGDVELKFRQMDHAISAFSCEFRWPGIVGRSPLGYTSDTGPCRSLQELAHQCDTLLAECAVRQDDKRGKAAGHLCPRTIGHTAMESRVRRLILTHFAPSADPDIVVEEASTEFHGLISAAKVGLTYELGPASGCGMEDSHAN